jgi:hydrogenase maturation protein HypF
MIVRRRVVVTGVVQGVGFRPAVARAAASLGLSGWVANTRGGAEIEVEGEVGAMGDFVTGFMSFPPRNARIDSLSVLELLPLGTGASGSASGGAPGFEIGPSLDEGPSRFSVPPDIALCPECRREFEDPGNRRYRHPFISCGDCGREPEVSPSLHQLRGLRAALHVHTRPPLRPLPDNDGRVPHVPLLPGRVRGPR